MDIANNEIKGTQKFLGLFENIYRTVPSREGEKQSLRSHFQKVEETQMPISSHL